MHCSTNVILCTIGESQLFVSLLGLVESANLIVSLLLNVLYSS